MQPVRQAFCESMEMKHYYTYLQYNLYSTLFQKKKPTKAFIFLNNIQDKQEHILDMHIQDMQE